MTALDLAACRRGELAERLVPKALELACLSMGMVMRERSAGSSAVPGEERSAAGDPRLAVRVDRPLAELLEFVTWDEYGRLLLATAPDDSNPVGASGPAVRFPCGTYAAYRRHENRGELVDDDCARAARVYYRERYHRRKTSNAEAASEAADVA